MCSRSAGSRNLDNRTQCERSNCKRAFSIPSTEPKEIAPFLAMSNTRIPYDNEIRVSFGEKTRRAGVSRLKSDKIASRTMGREAASLEDERNLIGMLDARFEIG